jgi:PleD family two-component response regulator
VNQPVLCLLIDDDLDDQEIFCMALKEVSADIECMLANNAEQALERLQPDPSVQPDLIFIDLNMPLMNGFECLQELKKLEHLKDSEIFMYSTSSESRMMSKSLELGAKDFIVKPPSVTMLKEILSQVIDEHQK